MVPVKAAALLGIALLASAAVPLDVQLKHLRAANAFGVSLLKELRSTNEDANIFSPVSISLALGLFYAGARGTSQSELSSVLGFTDAKLVDRDAVLSAYKSLAETKTPNVTFDIANTILITKGSRILDHYKQDLADYFYAVARSMDFARDGARVAEEVNEWLRDKTKGKISSLLGGILPVDTVASLLNAVYFKGTWLTKFEAGKTKMLPF
ncbi:hypothetical protein HPB48_002444 [Haemaphysalis longicornis]|uniref:Serpin domain-containing protein n=1 Tax=Haemaphysalis longicornis TaxID=44386 RepID=A0A9J6FA81_HAELO|nr:hypothetical protein HPB48_002444 [Haemaphysalis longicornis]